MLQYEAGRIWVQQIIRPRYARTRAQQAAAETQAAAQNAPSRAQIVQAAVPDSPFPRLKAGVSLLVYILISKFVDHLPLYRIMGQFARQGLKIPDSTMCQWVSVAADHLLPLYKVYEKQIFRATCLQMDETTLKILEDAKGKCHLGYLWAVFDPVNKRPFFFCQKGRDHRGPKELLQSFAGTLQCDGYSVYETLNKKLNTMQLLNCMAHIRNEYNKVLPASKTGKAIAYALHRWDNMSRYLTDGTLETDNNLVENIIRPAAIGRKNYLLSLTRF